MGGSLVTLMAGMHTWPQLGSHCWEATGKPLLGDHCWGATGKPVEIRSFEGGNAYLATAGKPLLGSHWEATAGGSLLGSNWEATGDPYFFTGKQLEIRNFESGNAYLATAGKPLLGGHGKPREATGDP